MSLIIKTKSLSTIYREVGLENQGRVQKFLDKTVADNLRKYVSLDSGTQSKQTLSSYPQTGYVTINVPYARFQAEGKVMVGIKTRSAWARKGERKIVISKNLTYHNSSIRGAHPFERMKADKKDSILNQTANYARGLSGG